MEFCDHISPQNNNFPIAFPSIYLYNRYIRVFYTNSQRTPITHKKWGFNEKQQFEDYITRSREIHSLSMPPEEAEAHIGEIYRPLKNTDKLTKEELEEFKDFARALFNEEFDLIRLHPQMGYELLSKWDSTRPYAEAALYQILTCADCLDAATDSVGRLITAEREQLYREVFGKNVELVL